MLFATMLVTTMLRPPLATRLRTTLRPMRRLVTVMSEQAWPAAKVRTQFIEYFEGKEHSFVKSSPVVPYDDPTLLFANAGMNQFKPIFVGQAEPGSELAKLQRAANSQKCIRAGGKHNDLEDVGMDTYHHTFFEMLGSWSFGDYFKVEAIDWAWELLTKVYGLPPDRFYATYFEGDEKLGLAPDEEARQLWLRYLPPEHVIPGNAKDNFWEMGDTGPCGPCSEIHYDRIGGRDAAALVNQDDPDVLEVWNLVFMQFNREPSGELRQLPAQSVDTGMGFERLVSVLQDVRSNYDTDVFEPIFGEIQRVTGAEPYGRLLAASADEVLPGSAVGRDTAYRVIADHVRTLSTAIADGAVPSNEGRGYVLRRILRRAVRYGRQMLGAEEGFFAALVPGAIATLAEPFPELQQQQELVQKVIAEEEAAFSSMLARGIKEFNARADAIKGSAGVGAGGAAVVSGDDAFFLYDSMGFPLDLTELMAREAGLAVDTDGFAAAMEAQKARSQAANKASKGDGALLTLGAEQTAWLADGGVAFTDDSLKFDAGATPTARLRAIFTGDLERGSGGGFVQSAADVADGATVGLVLDQTSFFSQAGGQVSDVGALVAGDGASGGGGGGGGGDAAFRVTSVQSYGGYVLHIGTLDKGGAEGAAGLAALACGDTMTCSPDAARRAEISKSHTLTHALNLALHTVLGDGVNQKGSLVDEQKARFDFSHGAAMSADECERVETLVREMVAEELPVHIETVPLDQALAINNLRAVFGERYPDPVRVVSIGPSIPELLAQPDSADWEKFSIELCGGTHIPATSTLGGFALVEETAVAKGVRRVVGLSGKLAAEADAAGAALKGRLAAVTAADPAAADAAAVEDAKKALLALKLETDAAATSVHVKVQLRDAIEAANKAWVQRGKQLAAGDTDKFAAAALEAAAAAAAAGDKFVVLELDAGVDGKAMQPIVQRVVKETRLPVIALSVAGGKVGCMAAVPPDVLAGGQLAANTWLQGVLKEVDGRGGGKPAQAQGSGSDVDGLPRALEVARQLASDALV